MQPRTCRIDLLRPALAALALLSSACRSDLTAPRGSWSAESSLESAGRHVFRGPNHTYVLDENLGTVQESNGGMVRLPRENVRRFALAFDQLAKARAMVDRFDRNAHYRHTVAQFAFSMHRVRATVGHPSLSAGPLLGTRASVTDGTVSSPASSWLGVPTLAQPVDARLGPGTADRQVYGGGDLCADIELAIYDESKQLNVLETFYDKLFQIALQNVNADPSQVFVYTPEGSYIALNTAFTQTAQKISDLMAKLNGLSSLYSQLGCASNDPYGQAPGGSGDGGTCTDEPASIEESYDGGATWHVIWSGTQRVCSGGPDGGGGAAT